MSEDSARNSSMGSTSIDGRHPGELARPIVADDRFILATRDTGYRGTVAAIAELVDNSIQAGAASIRIFITEYGERAFPSRHRQVQVAVLDDGAGMDQDDLWTALQFGGSSRFSDRGGLGRFGMGLPNSSVSQSRRIDVYSWRSPNTVLSTYLDVDEVASRRVSSLPAPARDSLPTWVFPFTRDAGTLVIWSRCDRLDYRKATTLREKLMAPLGRTYRRAIWKGLQIWVDGDPVQPVDPLFCHPVTLEGGAAPYGTELWYELAVGKSGQAATVRVRFTELPVHEWAGLSIEEKRTRGVIGGAGISFLRTEREIDHGWRLFGEKRRENYDDWWRCELSFGPDLDEEFGVTHSKQGVNPSGVIRAALSPDLEAIGRELNARARRKFETLKASRPSRAVALASDRDSMLQPRGRVAVRTSGSNGLTYRIVVAALDSAGFFRADQRAGRLVMTINTNHPFFERIYEPACQSGDTEVRFAIETMLLAAARAEFDVATGAHTDWVARHREAWSDALVAFLDAQT